MIEKLIDLLKGIQIYSEGTCHYEIIKRILKDLINSAGVDGDVEIRIKYRLLDGSPYGPDVVILKNGKILSIVEYKKENSSEFNVDLRNNNCLKSQGELPKFNEFIGRFVPNNRANSPQYPNKPGDGIGQVRGYYYTSMYRNELYPNAFAILTNGKNWVIFELRKPTDGESLEDIASNGINCMSCVHLKDRDSGYRGNRDKVYYCSLPDDEEYLIEYLKDRLKRG